MILMRFFLNCFLNVDLLRKKNNKLDFMIFIHFFSSFRQKIDLDGREKYEQ